MIRSLNILKQIFLMSIEKVLTSKIKPHLVIARHHENLDWVREIEKFFSKITIYDKGNKPFAGNILYDTVKLQNVGRECHTFLYHIIQNYANLNEYTHILYCQGKPFDQCKDFTIKAISQKNYDANSFYFNDIGTHEINFYYEPMERIHPIGLPVYNFFYHLFFDTYMLKLPQSRNSIMIIPVKNILHRHRQFYKYLFQYLNKFKNPLEGHIFERLWVPIFDGKTKDWISHYYDQRTKFLGEWNNMKID